MSLPRNVPDPDIAIKLPKRAGILLGALAALVIAGYSLAWKAAPVETSDSSGYYEVAHDLKDFRLEQIHYRPPGYPLWLRVLGFADRPATKRLVVAGLFLHALGLWMLVQALHDHGLSRRALVSFALVLVLPPFVQPAAYVASENLAQFLLVSGFSATLGWIRSRRMRYLWLAGAALAGAALTRPTFQALALAMALCLTLCSLVFSVGRRELRRNARAGIFLAVASSVPVVAFAGFNYIQFGWFTTSPGNLSYSLSTKTVNVLERIPDEYAAVREAMIAARDEQLVERGSSHTAEQYYPRAKAAAAEVTGLNDKELEALLLRLNLELIARAPLNYALHVGQSAVAYWFPTIGEINTGESRLLHLTWAGAQFLVVAWFFLQLAVLGGLSIFAISRRVCSRGCAIRREPKVSAFQVHSYALALTIVFYTMAVSCLVHHGEPRFRTVTDPLIVFSCFLGSSIWRRLIVSSPGASASAARGRLSTRGASDRI